MIKDTIWLQAYDEDGDELDEKTWCEDKINPNDVEYRRVKPAKRGNIDGE